MKPCFDFTVQTLINEGRLKRSDVDDVKSWLEEQKDLPELTEEQIACFLLSCNNETAVTRATIKAHYALKKNLPELFDYKHFDDDEDVQKLLKVGYYVILPLRTQDGSAIIYQGVKQPVSGRYTRASIKIWATLFETICKEQPPKSLIIICDFKKLGVMNLAGVKISYVRGFIHYLQEALPLKLKTIYNINVSSVATLVKSLTKPFMKPEVYNSVNFLPADAVKPTLAQTIGVEYLPQDLGGKLPCLDTLHENTVQKLLAMKPFLDAEQRQRHNL